MRFEEAPSDHLEHLYTVLFEDGEWQVVSAVFKERLHDLAIDQKTHSASCLDVALAGWNERSTSHAIYINSPEDIAEQLKAFGEATDNVIEGLPWSISIAAFENDAIPERLRIGREALRIAAQLEEKAEDYAHMKSILIEMEMKAPPLANDDAD
ncbi:MAG: hypothetical protein WA843_02355 [Candidatus Saccharimonadales bacterium]